eukprot:scaffold150721_cov35-Tisochrysis_lutea.AAC.1
MILLCSYPRNASTGRFAAVAVACMNGSVVGGVEWLWLRVDLGTNKNVETQRGGLRGPDEAYG